MRAKFLCNSVTDYGNNWTQATLQAVYSATKTGQTIKEDNEFAAATPNGKLEMTITNPAAIGFLKPGKKYYLDFTEAPEPAE